MQLSCCHTRLMWSDCLWYRWCHRSKDGLFDRTKVMDEFQFVFDDSTMMRKHKPTVILFWVRVPVLSEQIVEVDPRVSTDSRFLTRTFFLAILLEAKVNSSFCLRVSRRSETMFDVLIKRRTHGNGGDEAFRHVRNDDTDAKDDVRDDVIVKQTDQKEDKAHGERKNRDDLDKMFDLLSNGRISSSRRTCKVGDLSDDRSVTCVDDNSETVSFNDTCAVKREVSGLERIVVCRLGCSCLRIRLSRERRVVNLFVF